MVEFGRLTHKAKVGGFVILLCGAFAVSLMAQEEPIRVPSKTVSGSGSEDGGD